MIRSRLADAVLSGHVQTAVSSVMLNSEHCCQVLPGDILLAERKFVLLGIRQAISPVVYPTCMSSVDEQAPYWDKGTARTIHLICVHFISLSISTG